jgi:hypothetical protein
MPSCALHMIVIVFSAMEYSMLWHTAANHHAAFATYYIDC